VVAIAETDLAGAGTDIGEGGANVRHDPLTGEAVADTVFEIGVGRGELGHGSAFPWNAVPTAVNANLRLRKRQSVRFSTGIRRR
jgi:hypothetical protein